jgi:hypothetical protein
MQTVLFLTHGLNVSCISYAYIYYTQ